MCPFFSENKNNKKQFQIGVPIFWGLNSQDLAPFDNLNNWIWSWLANDLKLREQTPSCIMISTEERKELMT